MRISLFLFVLFMCANAAHAGSACLSWTPPTQNTDGSPLTNLAGYRIYYGESAAVLHQTIQLNNAALTTYCVNDLAPGPWYFAVTAFTSTGAESAKSNIASKVVRFPGPTDGAIEAPTDGAIEDPTGD